MTDLEKIQSGAPFQIKKSPFVYQYDKSNNCINYACTGLHGQWFASVDGLFNTRMLLNRYKTAASGGNVVVLYTDINFLS